MKLVWKVGEKPTGPYRAFFKRGWPAGYVGELLVFRILSGESYSPALVRQGLHQPIKLGIVRASRTNEERVKHGRYYWVQTKASFLDLASAKAEAYSRLAGDERLQSDIEFWLNQQGT